jgi:diguanylate cyclase (GGDEF)-like protein
MIGVWRQALSERRAAVWAAALASIVLIAVIDYVSGVEVRTFPLYYAPISLVSWHRGRSGACVAAAICAAAWLASNLLAGLRYSATSIWLINTLVQGASFLTVGLLIAVLRDAAVRERDAAVRERALNRVDSLTLLLNSRAFYEEAQPLLSLCRRRGYAVTMVYVDLDKFKEVNDRLGHRAGDELLRAAGRLLRESVRPSDLLARLGGDEFAMLLPDADSRAATAMLERLRALLESSLAALEVPVTGSIGAVTFMPAQADVERMVHEADVVMYAAKAAGGNRVRLEVVPPLASCATSPRAAEAHGGPREGHHRQGTNVRKAGPEHVA